MSYDVGIVADSIAPHGGRITTFQLRYPRFIHQEFLTHRSVSRNSSSTRAIPLAKQIKAVEDDPAMPVFWGSNRNGMQATEELDPGARELGRLHWLAARDVAVDRANRLMDLGAHKQIVGRILEPFQHISVVATATDWANFFALRCHPAAMPEIQVLAVKMARAFFASDPDQLSSGQWHLPYVTDDEWNEYHRRSIEGDDEGRRDFLATLRFSSVARCARVSYLNHDGTDPDVNADVSLHDRLRDSGHWSPFEHQATPCRDASVRSGNFRGWCQYRQLLPRSVHTHFTPADLAPFEGRDFVV